MVYQIRLLSLSTLTLIINMDMIFSEPRPYGYFNEFIMDRRFLKKLLKITTNSKIRYTLVKHIEPQRYTIFTRRNNN